MVTLPNTYWRAESIFQSDTHQSMSDSGLPYNKSNIVLFGRLVYLDMGFLMRRVTEIWKGGGINFFVKMEGVVKKISLKI